MVIRNVFAVVISVVVLSDASALAWPNTRTPTQFPPKARAVKPTTPIAVAGCIQRESDYRRAHDRGPGGFAGTSWGLGNEYVLIKDCAPGEGAYELTGRLEGEAAPFVGRRVAMTGMLKDAETRLEPVGTSGRYVVRPTGGFDPLNQDLRLYEVNVTSLRELAPRPVRRLRPIAQAPIAEAQPDTAGQPDTAAQITPAEPEGPPLAERDQEPRRFSENLPRTASPLPLAGLLAFLSLGGALVLRAQRRR